MVHARLKDQQAPRERGDRALRSQRVRRGCMRARLASAAAWTVPCATPVAAQTGAARPAAEAPEAFVHESWTGEDGLPVNSINALVQSRDGYLWIATFDGLVRFDGMPFTVFSSVCRVS